MPRLEIFDRGRRTPEASEETKAKTRKVESDWSKKTHEQKTREIQKDFPEYKGPMKQSDHHKTPMRYYHEED